MIVTELPDTIYLQVGGDEYDGGEPFDTNDVTWCSDNIFDTDVEYRRVKPVENGVDSTSWHARFIAEQCGNMQRWRRVGLAAFLEDTEKELGRSLPEPRQRLTKLGHVRLSWYATDNRKQVTLNIAPYGTTYLSWPQADRQDEILTEPAQLADALKELYKGEG